MTRRPWGVQFIPGCVTPDEASRDWLSWSVGKQQRPSLDTSGSFGMSLWNPHMGARAFRVWNFMSKRKLLTPY